VFSNQHRSAADVSSVRRFFPLVLAAGAVCLAPGCGIFANSDNSAGVQLYQQGAYEQAGARFQQAINNSPKHPDGYYNLGSTLHQSYRRGGNLQDAEMAETFYNQCLDRDPEHVACHRALAVLLVEKNDPDAAFRLLNNWAARSTAPAEAKVELARLHQEFKDPEEARKRLHEALEIDPNFYRARTALASMQEQTGDYTQALANYTLSYQKNPLQPGVRERIASLQQATGTSAPLAPASITPRVVTAPFDLRRY
jgi:tetratricopeptide (TPR) repeat protein